MNIFYFVISFIFGLFTGSFLNVVADRVINGESIFWGRSHCDKCKRVLGPLDLIPVFSFLLSGGKCKKCGLKLSKWYPASEILTGIAFAGAFYLAKGLNQTFIYLIVVFSFYIVLLLTDAKYGLIPDKVVFPGIAFVVIFTFLVTSVNLWASYSALKADEFGKYLLQVGYWKTLLSRELMSYGINLLSAIGILLFFLFLVLFTKGRGMGGGDITLGLLIGLFNEFPNNVLAIFLGFVFGAVFVLPLVALKVKSVKDTIAFGPFMILGSIVSYIFGSGIINWYIRLLSH